MNEINDHKEKIATFLGSIAEFKENPPEVLHQYTHSSTFINVLQCRKLWLTEFRYLNDPSEFSHGMNYFFEKFETFWMNVVSDPRETLPLINFMKETAAHPDIKMFVGSFTENEDLLSQWRGYGDNGFGLSLGFRTASINHEKEYYSFWAKVIYEDSQKAEIVNSVFQDFEQLWWKCLAHDHQKSGEKIAFAANKDILVDLVTAYLNIASLYSIRFKNSAWTEEKEWRLIKILHMTKDKSYVRERDCQLIEYFEFDLIDPIFSKIFVGPRADYLNQKNCIDILTKKSAEVKKTTIPWR